MKNNFKKTVCTLLTVIISVLVLFNTSLAFADGGDIDFTKKGTVHISLKCNGEPVQNAEFTLCKVANPTVKNNSLYFSYTDDFKSFSSDIKSLSSSGVPDKLEKYISDRGINGVAKSTDKSGYIGFTWLDLGLYLVSQTKSVSGYSDCSPFIVYLPYPEDGVYKYEIDASPKTNIKPITSTTTTTTTTTTAPNSDNNDTTTTTTKRDEHGIGGGVIKDKTTKLNKDKTKPGYIYVTDEYGNVIDIIKDDNYSDIDLDGDGDENGNDNSSTEDEGHLYKTGQNRVIVPVLAVCGAFIFLMGCIILYRDKEKADE